MNKFARKSILFNEYLAYMYVFFFSNYCQRRDKNEYFYQQQRAVLNVLYGNLFCEYLLQREPSTKVTKSIQNTW